MTYAIILAGGFGTRMKNSLIPKQFMNLKGKPIITHTIEKFLLVDSIDKIIIPCKEDWIQELEQMINKYTPSEKIKVITGGNSRNMSIKNSIEYINSLSPSKEDVIITHDAVRPFLSIEIIKNNVKEAKSNEMVIDTCVKAVDTIVQSKNNDIIDNIPNRDKLYLGQTPQSCKYWIAKQIYSKEYDEYLFSSTDLCRLAIENNIKTKIVEGDYFNIKITTDFDMYLAKLIIGEENE